MTLATQDVTGINVSKLANGELTFSVTLKNSVRYGPVEIAQPNASIRRPPGYKITADNPAISNRAAGRIDRFHICRGRGGRHLHLHGNRQQRYKHFARERETATLANQNVTGINVSKLSNGQITFSVTLTNPVGSTAATTTATLELSPSPTPSTVPNPTDSTNWSGYAVQTNSEYA